MPTSTLLFVDSFDHYSTSQIGRKWTSNFGGCTIVSDGRTGQGMDTGPNDRPQRTLPGTYTELSAGVAYRLRAGATGFFNAPLGFGNAATGVKVLLTHVGDGRLWIGVQVNEWNSWTVGSGNTLSGSTIFGPPSTLTVLAANWYYLELQATMGLGTPSGGNATLTFTANAYLNGALLCSITQSGTVAVANYGNLGFSYVQIQGNGGAGTATFDDLYVTDIELLNDVKIAVLYPNTAGDTTAWTASPAGSNFTNVKEHIADDDATVVTASAAGTVDLYNLDDITGFTGTIKGAQSCILSKKSDTGAATIQSQLKSSGTVYAGQAFNPSNGSYIYDLDAYRVSPFTSTGWTVAEINALQLGQKRTA